MNGPASNALVDFRAMALPLEHDPHRLTYRDWLALPEDVGRLYELLDGDLLVSPAPSLRHQRLVRKLLVFLAEYLARGGRGEVFTSPIGVKLSELDVPEPDLSVVLAEHSFRLGEQAIEGPPDLVVEVLSPGSARRDLGPKRELYERSGVQEYWIVDPAAERIEVLSLAGGRYTSAGLFERHHSLRSPLLPGLEIALADVFEAMS